jgi:hypothetical protein
MKTIWRAAYDSRHFSFEAYAFTKEAAINELITGLRLHARQYDLEPDWWEDQRVAAEDQFDVREYELGVAYRDHQPLRTH